MGVHVLDSVIWAQAPFGIISVVGKLGSYSNLLI